LGVCANLSSGTQCATRPVRKKISVADTFDKRQPSGNGMTYSPKSTFWSLLIRPSTPLAPGQRKKAAIFEKNEIGRGIAQKATPLGRSGADASILLWRGTSVHAVPASRRPLHHPQYNAAGLRASWLVEKL
jgi:hypothetical protein